MIEVNFTFFMVLFSFVIFMLAMRSLYFEPIRNIKAERARKIEEDQRHAQSLHQERDLLNRDYEAGLKEARQKAQHVILEFRENAKKQASEQVTKARNEAAAQLEQQMAEIATWREEAYQQLESEKRMLADGIIHKLFNATSPVNTLEHH